MRGFTFSYSLNNSIPLQAAVPAAGGASFTQGCITLSGVTWTVPVSSQGCQTHHAYSALRLPPRSGAQSPTGQAGAAPSGAARRGQRTGAN